MKGKSMRICIIGGVAGGASVAARLRRLHEQASITLFEMGPFVSFANCGLPYVLGGVIDSWEKLVLQTPESLQERFRLDVRVETEVLEIDRKAKMLRVRSPQGESRVPYDKLVLATGAKARCPWSRPGIHPLTTIKDLVRCMDWIKDQKVQHMAVIGGGYIGLEAVENLRQLGIQVTLVHSANQVLQPLSEDLSALVHEELVRNGVQVFLRSKVTAIEGDGPFVILTEKERLRVGGVLVAMGVEPRNELAKKAELSVEPSGGILVETSLQTVDPDIYAVGDVIGTEQPPLMLKAHLPLAGPANKQGRLVADHLVGRPVSYTGTLGTSVLKVFDLEVAFTGHHPKQLRAHKKVFETTTIHPSNHVTYYPGAKSLSMKLFFDPKDGLILGGQAVGPEGCARRIDVLATAIYARLRVQDLEHLELCYAPPFGSAKDPINMLGFQASNVLRGDLRSISVEDVIPFLHEYLILDVRTPQEHAKGHIKGAMLLPLPSLREGWSALPKDRKMLTYCQVGFRGYLAYRILVQEGFQDVRNLSGGYLSYTHHQLAQKWKS
jgi:NADPH-dependent 2,4-dienoyl-CoA reductase/sulfur reductase-like enzyme/rhodanese-related sulfurtransferase